MNKCFYGTFLFLSSIIFVASANAADSWSYNTREDKMTSTSTRTATLMSDNTLNLPFPYKDPENYGFLIVRQMAGKPLDILVSIKKGQILCPGYGDGCTVTVRFDSDKPIRFRAIGPNDHSSTAFFIHNTNQFLTGAKKASRILIQFTMYNAGEQTLEFNPVQRLEWNSTTSKKK